MTVQHDRLMLVQMLSQEPEHFRLGSTLGAVILEKGNGPGSGEGHRNGPVAHRPAVHGGPARLATNGVAVVEKAQLFEQGHDSLIRIEAGRREPRWFAE